MRSQYLRKPWKSSLNRHLPFEAQKRIEVAYDGQVMGVHVIDLMIAHTLILELKAAKSIDDTHCAQLRSLSAGNRSQRRAAS